MKSWTGFIFMDKFQDKNENASVWNGWHYCSQAAGSRWLVLQSLWWQFSIVTVLFINTLCSHGKVRVNQIVCYVHSCLEFAVSIKKGINNPNWKEAVFESSSLGCLFARQCTILQKIPEPRTLNVKNETHRYSRISDFESIKKHWLLMKTIQSSVVTYKPIVQTF